MIPHSRPFLKDSDREAVCRVLQSGRLSQGPYLEEFERKFAGYIGKRFAAATSSGTAALHLSLLALGVKEGDDVVIPSFVCSAVLNAVNYTGANPVVVDIDPLTFNISAEAVEKAITGKTRAIIVPHLFGLPADIAKINALNIPVVEDCAQAAGATFKGRRAGRFGLLSAFSFYATKVLTTGEGGMVLSDSDDLMAKVKDLRDYDNRDDYLLRYNYKMTDVQAALGLSQLSSLEGFIEKRREVARRYFEEFRNCSFQLPVWKERRDHIYYRFVVKTEKEASSYLEKFKKEGVIARRPVYKPLHLYLGLSGFPGTAEAWEKAVSIPLYPSLTEKEVEKIIEVVRKIF